MLDSFPSWDASKASQVTTGGQITGIQLEPLKTIAISSANPDRVLAVVCSYDCDLENPRSRWGVALAPLMPLPSRHSQFARLIQSGVPDELGEDIAFTFLNVFPYPAVEAFHDSDQMQTAALADFSRIMHLGKADAVRGTLIENVVHRLNDDVRANFQMKLAMFMARH